ncbi:hypothetical protein [Pantoea agglomerans]|uniref:hypothetical protein n=1 Tax=Enterobacter agglomerans TaxID=549 RepID=UPI0037C65827
MEKEFEEQAHDAACRIMGEAIWQLVITSQSVSQEAIARMILELSDEPQTLGVSIALSVLFDSNKN